MSIVFESDYEIECLGEMEEWVYDIEVEDNHNFFANNVAVHNSLYLDVQKLVELICDEDDTDDVVADKLHDFAEKMLLPRIHKEFDRISALMGCPEGRVRMSRDVISPASVFVAKKRYTMLVKDQEGERFKTTKLKVTGLESVRSSTPEIARHALEGFFRVCMEGDETDAQAYVADFRRQFDGGSVNEVSFPRGINGITQYQTSDGRYKKGCPVGPKGAITYNRLLKENGLVQYKPISDGAKAKFFYLTMPNPADSTVLAFVDDLPPELDFIAKYCDKDTQFVKCFLEPAKVFFEILNWSVKKRHDGFSLFDE